MNGGHVQSAGHGGFTLIEVIVVLVVMLIAVAVVAPAFLPPERDDSESEFTHLLRDARSTAASRGETLYIRINASGDWLLESTASPTDGAIATGSVSDYSGPAATIIVSPIGTCAFDVRSTTAWSAVALDPMACEVVRS